MATDTASLLQELGRLSNEAHEVDLLLIPGIGTANVDEWGLCSGSWQEKLRSWKAGVRYWEFCHGVEFDQNFTWQKLMEAGDRLHNDLITLYDSDETDRRPLVLVCHSLGGLILKQALYRLNVQATQNSLRYHRYLNRISGIAFISTPHGSSESDAFSESCMLIIKQYASIKLNSQSKNQLKEAILSHRGPHMIARRFDDIQLGTEVLSVYENLPTKRKDSGWKFGKQKHPTIIVDESLAHLQVSKEELVGIAADHNSTCNLTESDGLPQSQVLTWFEETIENGRSRVADNFRSYAADEIRNPDTPTLSIDTASVMEASSDFETQNESQKAQKGSLTFEGGLNTIFENFVPPTNKLNLPCYMIDTFARNESFFGRGDILDTLDRVLLPETDMIAASEPGIVKSTILIGPGGFGKTEIAVQFVWLRKEKFDAVFWVRAEDESKVDIDFRQIAARLGLQKAETSQDPVIVRSLVTEWLSKPRKVLNTDDDDDASHITPQARWLLVFDNADNPDLLEDYVQIYGRGSILITSRDPRARELCWKFESPGVIEIEKFKLEEGIDFLAHHAKKTVEPDTQMRIACEEIVKHHDGHPLALAQVAGFIRHQYLSYPDILGYIRDPAGRMRLFQHKFGMRETARGNVVDLVAIGIENLPQESKDLLEILSFLDPDRIQESIFEQPGQYVYFDARGPLLKSSLVRRSEAKNELWMHRVDQAAVKAKLGVQGSVQPFATAVDLVTKAWPAVEIRQRHTVKRWPQCEALYPHVVALQTSYAERKESWPVEVQQATAELLQKAAWWQYERGNFKRSKPMGDLALSLAQKFDTTLQQRERLSLVYDLLGCIANGTNKPRDSLRNNTEFLNLRTQITKETGQADVLLAYSHNQMGCSHMMLKNYDKGAGLFIEALSIWHSLPSYKPGDASMEYANLGLAFLLQGKIEEASKILEEGYKERVTGYGEDDIESFRPGRILYALGNVREAQGRLQESQKLHEKALLTFQNTTGNRYHRTADVSHKLARHCLRQKSFENAMKLVEEALSVWTVNQAAYKPEITRTSFLKARIVDEMGSTEEAKRLLEGAVKEYHVLVPGVPSKQDLTEFDCDELVAFWSR